MYSAFITNTTKRYKIHALWRAHEKRCVVFDNVFSGKLPHRSKQHEAEKFSDKLPEELQLAKLGRTGYIA